MPKSRKQVFDEIKNHDLDKVESWIPKMDTASALKYDKYIKDYKESLALERQEAREEESLSISR